MMTTLMWDVGRLHGGRALRHRVLGADFDGALYADDTICVSQDARAMNLLLKGIEKEGRKYWMRLNSKKCELMRCHANVRGHE